MVGGSVGYVGSCRWVGEVDLSRFATLSVIKVGIELLGWLKTLFGECNACHQLLCYTLGFGGSSVTGDKGGAPKGWRGLGRHTPSSQDIRSSLFPFS